MMPAVAGAAKLRYRTFLLASVSGSALWSLVWVGAGSPAAELLRSRSVTALPLAVTMLTAIRLVSRRLRPTAMRPQPHDPLTHAVGARAPEGLSQSRLNRGNLSRRL